MIPFSLSVAFGIGAYLLFLGLTARPRPAADGAAQRTLERLRRLQGTRDFLTRAGLQGVSPRDFALFSLGAGAACALLAQLFLGWGLVSALAFAMGLTLPLAYFVRRHDRRRTAVQAALVDSIAQLRDSIRTGQALHEAFAGLAQTGPEALRPEFDALVTQARLGGLRPALLAMQARLADPLFDTVCAALVLSDELGGRNVSQLLDRLVEATRGQLRLQEELRAQQARNVLSARIVAAIPLVLLAAIRTLNPRYVAVFDTLLGQLLLAGCAASIALGYVLMVWLTRLPEDRRVLA